MDKQKALLQKLFEHLGYNTADAESMAVSFLSPDEGADPVLDHESILGQAQAYAKPILKTGLKKELSSEFKGQYFGEAINKVIAASKGVIKRSDFEGDFDGALAALLEKSAVKVDKSSEAETINDLRQQIATLQQEKDEAVNNVRSEYSEKENSRMVFDAVLKKIGALEKPGEGKVGKKLTVAQDHAAKGLLRELSEDFIVKWDAEAKDIVLYDKSDPNLKAHVNNVPVKFDNLLPERLSNNNWIAQSNGGLPPKEIITRNIQGHVANGAEPAKSLLRQQIEAKVGDAA